MQDWLHFLLRHGITLVVIGFALYEYFAQNRRQQAEKARKLEPPKSAPAPEPMPPQTLPSQAPQTMKKTESPWTNSSNDPFNS